MKLRTPVIRGNMDRRILIHYRIDPNALDRLLPAPFRARRVRCWGVAGICLIRLRQSRPRGLPRGIGFRSENAAYRFAVEWDDQGETRTGVYIPIRHTGFRLNALAGGRIFPGRHTLSDFDVHETGDLFKIGLTTRRPNEGLKLICRRSGVWPRDSIFHNETEASDFIRSGSVGYSPTPNPLVYEGLELHTDTWTTSPLEVEHLNVAFFQNSNRFPGGAIRFDSALLMRDIEHEWRTLPPLVLNANETASKATLIASNAGYTID